MSRPEWHTPKGQRRRELLLDAAMRVIAAGGYAAATQRAIAAEAGVPAASTHYFFDSVDDLVAQAATRYLQQRVAIYTVAIEEFERTDATPAEACRTAAELLRSVSVDARSAQFDIYLHARRHHEQAAMVKAAIDELEALAERALTAIGVRDAAEWTAAFLAVGDGFALRAIAGADDPPERLERALLALVTASLTT